MHPNIQTWPIHKTALHTCIFILALTMFTSPLTAQNVRSTAPLSTSEIARRVTPTVVSIETATRQGSGVIVDPSGVVVSNLHVIQGETQVEVILHNGDIYDDIAVVDIDQRRDLVLLKIKAFNLNSAEFGDSDLVEVGEDVILVGSPQGLDLTLSEGVISAFRDSGNGYRLIQTSAPASTGSSGGGMFNTYGELVGIVTSQTREGQNLNFAVPVNYVRGLISATPETLTSLTELTRSNIGADSEHTDTASSTDNIELSDTKKFRTVIEDLMAIEDFDEILTLEDAGDGFWLAQYNDTKNLESVNVGVKLISDEFDDSIVWVYSSIPDQDKDPTSSQLIQILELSFYLNFAKVVINNDGDIQTMAEAELRTLDNAGLLRTIYAVANAADRVVGTLESSSNHAAALSRSRQSGDTSVDLLDGDFVIHYSSSEWTETPWDPQEADVDMMFVHHSNEVFLAIETNRMQIPIERIPDLSIQYTQSRYPDASLITRGFRTVNGFSCIYWEHTADINGVKFAYLSHAYSDSNGMVNIFGWTTPNLIEEYRSTIESFVAGLEVSQP